MKVLIAEDDPTASRVVHKALLNLGHDCIAASNGDEAWELFLRLHPDVVVTDRLMPGMDGLELCRRIRESDGASSYTVVILVTALDGRSHANEGMLAGADDYLTKPLVFDELRNRMIAAARIKAHQDTLTKSRRSPLADRARGPQETARPL